MQKIGTLYVVATPIGNLEDITLRAIKTLQEADVVLAEDTRTTKKLLSWLNDQFPIANFQKDNSQYSTLNVPNTKLESYHQHSKEDKKLWILNELNNGKNIALVTDAGTPGISDPGNELISYLLSLIPDLKVVPIPGPSAIATALSISGFDVNKFVFLGFMPKKKKNKLLNWLKESGISFSYYDSPHRIVKDLEAVQEYFGSGVEVVVAREMTKIHETIYRGSVEEVIVQLQKDTLKGEIVVVVNNKQ